VIDDEEVMAEMMGQMLEQSGYTTRLYTDSRRGVAFYREHASAVDCVLLDMVMPGMNGRECLDALRDTDPSVKVVLVSGHPAAQEARELLQSGGQAFLRKPFDRRMLCETVDAVLSPPDMLTTRSVGDTTLLGGKVND
jgi:CheY-like chemotaxis protein